MSLVKRSFIVAALAAFQFVAVGAGGGSSVAQAASSASADAFAKEVQGHLDQARDALEQVASVTGPRTIENTLVPYDMLLLHLDAAANMPGLLERVHPDPGVRKVAEGFTQEVDKFATELSLNREVFEALQALKIDPSDKVTHFYVKNAIRDYKRAGVDKDEATRQRIQKLNEELTQIGQEFGRNIQSDTRTIYVKQDDLVGLPDDYIRSHPAGEGGQVTITTDYPDYIPFMSYSKSDRARKELYKEFRNRAVPANLAVLDKLLAKRYELAKLLGYDHWADYITGDKMIGSDEAARDFITRIARISEPRAKADYATLLKYKRLDDPKATEVSDWEKGYYEEIVKSKEYQFDSQSVRPYYAYDRVKDGIMGLTATMFGIEYRQVDGVPVWSEDVETYDVYQGSERLGRFHLDMHPREDKYKHAAQFTIINGVKDKQLPEAALVCNFPGGEEGDPGLMEHDDVETFLHEFGHLLHTIFAGKQRWMGVAGISTEWDFVEAPSQMLE
jgi:thimet oligopeptidase